jgi:hypothetical protein
LGPIGDFKHVEQLTSYSKYYFFCMKMKRMKNRPFFLLSLLTLLACLGIIAAMQKATEDADLAKPTGYCSSIIALEFAEENATVLAVFNGANSKAKSILEQVNNIRWATYWDFLFLLAYTSFMVFFALICRKLGIKSHWQWAIGLALLGGVSDVFENLQLLQIFDGIAVGRADFSAIFGTLRLCTVLKFGAIAGFFLAMGPFFWRSNVLGKVVVVAASLALICWVLACFFTPAPFGDLLFLMIFLAFSGAMIWGLFWVDREL